MHWSGCHLARDVVETCSDETLERALPSDDVDSFALDGTQSTRCIITSWCETSLACRCSEFLTGATNVFSAVHHGKIRSSARSTPFGMSHAGASFRQYGTTCNEHHRSVSCIMPYASRRHECQSFHADLHRLLPLVQDVRSQQCGVHGELRQAAI